MTPLAASDALVLALLSAGLLLGIVRLWRGPSLPDRVVALDLITALTMGFVIAWAVAADQPVLLDALMVLALIGFVATVAFARYIERRTFRA